MMARGAGLWSARNQIIKSSSSTSGHPHSLDLPVSFQQRNQLVKFLWEDSESFRELEGQRGLDKFEMDPSSQRFPLTTTTGKEWKRQRPLICAAFSDLPRLSLNAAVSIDWRRTLSAHDILKHPIPQNNDRDEGPRVFKLDLKEAILEVSLIWLMRLFCGSSNSSPIPIWQERLKSSCFEFWKQSRSLHKNKKAIQNAMIRLEGALPWNCGNDNTANLEYSGILKALYTSPGLSQKQATDNAVNAMIASLDAVQSLVFWTLWNLSKTEEDKKFTRASLFLRLLFPISIFSGR